MSLSNPISLGNHQYEILYEAYSIFLIIFSLNYLFNFF